MEAKRGELVQTSSIFGVFSFKKKKAPQLSLVGLKEKVYSIASDCKKCYFLSFSMAFSSDSEGSMML